MKKQIQTIEIPLEIKAASAAGKIEGYGAIFGVEDAGGDTIAPGAFTASIAKTKADGRPLPMLWGHNPTDPVGSWHEFAEDAKGLFVKGQALVETTRGRDTLAFVKAGVISGLSIGYRTLVDEIDREGDTRTIKEAELWEVSLVTFPMQSDARVLDVKALTGMTERDIERVLRDGGFSAREAKAVISRCADLGGARDAHANRETARIDLAAERLLGAMRS